MRAVYMSGLGALTLVFAMASANAENGFSGMQLQGMDARIAAALGMTEAEGVLVRDVALGEAADLGGVKRGDLIIEYAGSEIENFEQLVAVAQATSIGQLVPVKVVRAGKTLSLKIKLGQKPDAWKVSKGAVAAIPGVGLTLAAVTPKIRQRFGLRWGATGVLVTLVDAEHAESQILERGDMIVQVNSLDVWMPDQVARAYEDAKTAQRERLLLLVERLGNFQFLLMPVKK